MSLYLCHYYFIIKNSNSTIYNWFINSKSLEYSEISENVTKIPEKSQESKTTIYKITEATGN